MNSKQATYQKNTLLKMLLAIIVLFSISYGYTSENTIRQTFQSETFHSKSNNTERRTVSYKRAVQLSVLDFKEGNNFIDSLVFVDNHNAQAKVKFALKYKQYYSFKSNLQFFSIKTISNTTEEISLA